jgi:hypothetical protein
MRVLEARFHRQSGTDFVVVGHLVWVGRPDRDPPHLRAAPSLTLESSPTTMLSKVEYLVAATAPAPFERLQRLRSRFWSFVEVPPAMLKGGH